MAVKKVGLDQIPKDILQDLQVLSISKKKEYAAIGHNYYEIQPTSAVKLMEALAELVDILEEVRQKKVKRVMDILNDEQKQQFDPLQIVTTLNDIMTDKDAIERLKALLPSVLEGVDETDLQEITIGQLIDVFDKVVAVNIATLPPSYRQQVEEAKKQFTGTEAEAAKNP